MPAIKNTTTPGLPVLQIILIIVVYVCLQACKLYAEVMVEAFLGNILGNTGKQYARLLFEGIVIGMGIAGAAAGSLISMETGLFILIGVVQHRLTDFLISESSYTKIRL